MDAIEGLGDRTRTLEVAEQRQAGNGVPAHFAMDGTEYWDYTNSDLYINDSGIATYGNSWQLIGGGGGPGFPHSILSATHVDTTPAVVVRGDVMTGQGVAPVWQRLAHPGAANRVLQSTALEIGWSANAVTFPAAGAVPVGTGANTQVAYWTGANTLVGDAGLTYDAATDTLSLANSLTFTGATGVNDITVPDNVADALHLSDAGGLEYLRIASTNAQPVVVFNDGEVDVDFRVATSTETNALFVQGSTNEILTGAVTNPIPALAGRGFTVVRDGSTENTLYAHTAPDPVPRSGNRHMVAGGTAAAPTATLVDHAAFMGLIGYDGAAYQQHSRAMVVLRASENWTAAAQGAHIEFWTDENGTIVRSEKARITHDGRFGLGTPDPISLFDMSASNVNAEANIVCYDDGAAESRLFLKKSDTDTIGTLAQTDDADWLGVIGFQGVTSTPDWGYGVLIHAIQRGVAGVTYIETDLILQTYSAVGRNANQLVLDGGTGFAGFGIVDPLGKVHIDQSNPAGAIPVLILDQTDDNIVLMKVIAIASNAGVDYTLVADSDFGTPGALTGWIQIEIQDDGNRIADGDYYIPFYAAPS